MATGVCDIEPTVPPTDPESMDVLADVLRALRLTGTAYFQADFRAPWGMALARGPVASFHVVIDGSCCMQSQDIETTLGTGDITVFPHGAEHRLADQAASACPPAPEVIGAGRRDADGRLTIGGTGQTTTIICGHFEYERAGEHPLLRALPPVLLLRRGEGTDAAWIETATRLAVMESNSCRPGSTAVVDRLAEALFIQVLRSHVERTAPHTGFLAALADPAISRALRVIHDEPGHAWTVVELARRAGVSRSVFAARFKDLLDDSPMHYLTQWRMHAARTLLGDRSLSIAQIADRVGYQSEFAFAKAFKRVFGEGPGAARRSA